MPMYPSEKISRLVRPKDLNSHGSLFGGTLIAWMDELAVIFAMKLTRRECVTMRFDDIVFKKNVFVNDILDISASVVETRLCHLKIHVKAIKAEKGKGDTLVAEGTAKFVALDENKKPVRIAWDA